MNLAEIDVNNHLRDDDADLKGEQQACKHFLVDSELEKRRHRVFNFAMSTFVNFLVNQKLDWVFNGLKCAAKETLRLDLFSKTLKMDRVDIFVLTRTIRIWRGRSLCVRVTTLPT